MTVGVVVATRNRRDQLVRTLSQLTLLPERPPIVVVDNGSTDGTAVAVAVSFPGVRVVRLKGNLGAAARNLGVRMLETDHVALCDDDSWWAPGALGAADRLLAAHPDVGLLAARILVGPDERLDPTCRLMQDSPIPQPAGLPGRRVLGFLGCGVVIRRRAFLEAGGFHPRFIVGGEEELLAIDLRRLGWELLYQPSVVAHHHPPKRAAAGARRRVQLRNALWVAWLRRPPRAARLRTLHILRRASLRDSLPAFLRAAGGWGWIRRERRPVSNTVECEIASLE